MKQKASTKKGIKWNKKERKEKKKDKEKEERERKRMVMAHTGCRKAEEELARWCPPAGAQRQRQHPPERRRTDGACGLEQVRGRAGRGTALASLCPQRGPLSQCAASSQTKVLKLGNKCLHTIREPLCWALGWVVRAAPQLMMAPGSVGTSHIGL